MIQAREFTSAAECIASAAAIRAKFYGRKPPYLVKDDPDEEIRKQPVDSVEEDVEDDYEQDKEEVSCNEHVIAFRQWQLEHEIAESTPRRQTMAEITREMIAGHPTLTVKDIQRPGRSQPMLGIRQRAMYEIRRRRPDISLPQIGRFFGGRDHTCVLHAIRMVEARMLGAAE